MGTVGLCTNQTDFKQEHLCKQDCKRSFEGYKGRESMLIGF